MTDKELDCCCLSSFELQLCEKTRKETAKEILQKVYDNCDNLVADNSPDSIDFVDFARNTLVSELVKKYGVEIEQ